MKEADPTKTRDVLYTSSVRRSIDGLLDLISLEGVYPSLLQGVGVPIERRVKSILQNGVVTRPGNPGIRSEPDDGLLLDIVNQMSHVATSGGNGLCAALRERTLVDLVAAMIQISFAPSNVGRLTHIRRLEVLLNEYVFQFDHDISSCLRISIMSKTNYYESNAEYAIELRVVYYFLS